MIVELECKKHPKYQVKRKPNCECEACWAIYWLTRLDCIVCRRVPETPKIKIEGTPPGLAKLRHLASRIHLVANRKPS